MFEWRREREVAKRQETCQPKLSYLVFSHSRSGLFLGVSEFLFGTTNLSGALTSGVK